METLTIRTATLDDLDAIAATEAASFPAAEAASREAIAARLAVFPNHFWLLEDRGRSAEDEGQFAGGKEQLADDGKQPAKNEGWLAKDEGQFAGGKGRVVSFVNGMVTNEATLRDEMFDDASLHDERGAWQMLFGVVTAPAFRRRGYAERLLRHVIDECRAQGRKGLVLTCKDRLLPYYAKFGFVSEGISASVHGGAVWYDMRLTF